MRVLFLDIDGVLNDNGYISSAQPGDGSLSIVDASYSNAHEIDPERVALVNAIVERTGCEVVLSSAWRLLFGLERVAAWLRERGARFTLLDQTPGAGSVVAQNRVWPRFSRWLPRRSDEIQAWLDEHPSVEAWAVIDDDRDADLGDGSFTHVRGATGIETAHVEAIVARLGERAKGRT